MTDQQPPPEPNNVALVSDRQAAALWALIQKVIHMRHWQRRYFKERSGAALAQAKAAEKDVDGVLERLEKYGQERGLMTDTQPQLFDKGSPTPN